MEFTAYVLMVDDNESIQELLRTSQTATAYADLEIGTDEEVLATVTVSRNNRIALNLEMSNGQEVTLTGQMPDRTKIPVILLAMNDLGTSTGLRQSINGDRRTMMPIGVMQPPPRLSGAVPSADGDLIRVRDLTIDRTRRMVKVGTETIHLTPTEYELLCLLATQDGGVLSHDHLLQKLWGVKNPHTVHLLRVNISNLRRKLETHPAGPCYVTTVQGIGYRLWTDL